MELPLAKCKADFLPDDTVLQHFIQVLNTRLRIFNELLRHQLDIRLDNKNVYDTYFNKRGRRRKKINVVISLAFCHARSSISLRVRLRLVDG